MSGVHFEDGVYSQSLTDSPYFTWNPAIVGIENFISRYEIAIGLTPGGSEILFFTSVGRVTSYRRTGLSLLSGVTYYATLRAVDGLGNISSEVQGDGWLVDNQAPNGGGLGMTNSAYTSYSTQSPVSSWINISDATTGGSGLHHYEFAIGLTSGGSQVLDWTNVGKVSVYRGSNLPLAAGITYYSSVRAVDNAGNISTVSTGPAWVVDTQSPDMTGVFLTNDSNYSKSTTQSPIVSWNPPDETGSGIDHYEFAIGTTAGGTQILPWTSVGTNTSYQRTVGLSLTNGTLYYASVRTVDMAGNVSVSKTAPPWLVDTQAPDLTSVNITHSAYTSSGTQSPAFSWSPAGADLGSGIEKYQMALGSSAGNGINNVVDWIDIGNVTTYTFTGLSLSEGSPNYFAALRAIDRAGNISGIRVSGAWTLDLPPSIPLSFQDMNTGSINESPQMTWGTSTDPGSGIAGFQLSLGTGPGLTDVLNWTDVGMGYSGNLTGLNLTHGKIYYSSLRSRDNSGNFSAPALGDGWRAISEWRSQDASPAAITGGGVYTSLLQPDNKRILGGDFTSVSCSIVGRGYLRKLTATGREDFFFDGTATTGFNNAVRAVAVQSDGKILVGGDFTAYNGISQNYITRLNGDGSRDSSFSIGMGFDHLVLAVAVQPDGKILVGGVFTAYNGTNQNYITRLNGDGSRDVSFSIGTGFNSSVYAIVIQSDGKILVWGNFTAYNGNSQNYITRLNGDGSRDVSFSMGAGFDSSVNAIALQPDGKILVGGWFTNYNGTSQNHITRLNGDGSRDSSFSIGTGFNNSVNAIALQSDGKILVGGWFTTYNGTSQNHITRLNGDGSRDSSFSIGTGFSNDTSSISVQLDGKILVAGGFGYYNGISQNHITRLNGDGSWDSSWSEEDVLITSFIYALAISSDGGIIIGGLFGSTPLDSQYRLTRLGSDGIRDLSFSVGKGFDSFVRALGLQSDGKILVGGSFTTYQGSSQNRIVRLASDGSKDSSFSIGTGFNADVNAISIQPDGKILIGGDFTSYNGTSKIYIARINTDGVLDTTFSLTGTGLDSSVKVISLQTDGKIILGGYFTSYNGASQPYIIRLNTDGTQDASFTTTGLGLNGPVYTLALQSDGAILVGGSFYQYNGISRPYLLRLKSDGTLDTSFSLTGNGLNSDVYSINLQTDGKILVGGAFNSYNGTNQGYMTRLNADGSLDTSFLIHGGGFNGVVRTLSLQSDGKILSGGDFTTYYDTTGALTGMILLGW